LLLSVLRLIYIYITAHNIQELLQDVLAISSASDLSDPNRSKACNLAICILHEQNLPETVLLAKKDGITVAISRALQRGLTEGSHEVAINGLKVKSLQFMTLAYFSFRLHMP
jgi:hypothetical protein